MNIFYLILHYKNINDTLVCVDSISKLNDFCDLQVIIVDNGSDNGTYEELVKKFELVSNITVITTGKNIGFSRGNNFGYSYIKNHYSPDFIVVANNDIIFYQMDFCQRIINCYEKEHFYLLGPDIFVRETKEHQSPLRLTCITLDEATKDLEYYLKFENHPKKYALVRNLQIHKNKMYFKCKLFRKFYDCIKKNRKIDKNKLHYDCCLQGACIIISSDFIKKEEKIFSPETFLYCEEIFLHLRCHRCNYKMVYEPSLAVYHEDSSSIKTITKNSVDKAKFTLQYHIASRKILVEYLERSE